MACNVYAFYNLYKAKSFHMHCDYFVAAGRIEKPHTLEKSINCKTNSSICFSLRVASYSSFPLSIFKFLSHIHLTSYIIFLISFVMFVACIENVQKKRSYNITKSVLYYTMTGWNIL